MSIPKDLYSKAKDALTHAYAPYSNFSVGAAVRGESQQIYAGCNVENAAYPLTQCAEGNAIAAMIAHGDRKITEALVIIEGNQICPPCGGCRQKLLEFASLDAKVHLCTTEGKHETLTIKALLPHAFDAHFLEKS